LAAVEPVLQQTPMFFLFLQVQVMLALASGTSPQMLRILPTTVDCLSPLSPVQVNLAPFSVASQATENGRHAN